MILHINSYQELATKSTQVAMHDYAFMNEALGLMIKILSTRDNCHCGNSVPFVELVHSRRIGAPENVSGSLLGEHFHALNV